MLLGIPFGLTSENENWQSYLKTIVGTCGGVESRQIDKRTDSEIVPSEVAQKFLILMIEFKDEQWKNLKPIKPYVLGKLRSGKAGCRFFPVAAKEFLSPKVLKVVFLAKSGVISPLALRFIPKKCR